MLSFLHSFQSEWLKKKRSAAAWLTIVGGFLVPTILLIARIDDRDNLHTLNLSPDFWESQYNRSWQFMGLFLLPMGVILAASLITQLEYKNNTWKQLHTTPQTFTTIFFAKLSLILIMMLQFFILFNIGMYLSAIIPSILFSKVPFPTAPLPLRAMLQGNGRFYLACLPIIGLQYLVSLQFKNFLVPVGAGLAMYVSTLIVAGWKYSYLLPYSYCALNFSKFNNGKRMEFSIHTWELGYFAAFTILGYILYVSRREKG